MRLFPVLPVLSLLFGAHASSFDSRRPAAHPLDARDLLDVCASVSVNLSPVVDIGQFNVLSSQSISSALYNGFDRCLSLSVGSPRLYEE